MHPYLFQYCVGWHSSNMEPIIGGSSVGCHVGGSFPSVVVRSAPTHCTMESLAPGAGMHYTFPIR